jgi:hypothetical protein
MNSGTIFFSTLGTGLFAVQELEDSKAAVAAKRESE